MTVTRKPGARPARGKKPAAAPGGKGDAAEAAKPPRLTNAGKAEMLLDIAKARWGLHRGPLGPYAVLGGRELRLGARSHRGLLRADLRVGWREKAEGDCPDDGALNSVIDQMQLLAGDVDPDLPPPDRLAAGIVDEAGVPDDGRGGRWDMAAAAESYQVRSGALGWLRPMLEGPPRWTPLATFTAEITDEVIRDDGAEQHLLWTLQVTTPEGRSGSVQIPPDQLGRGQMWATRAVGHGALVMPGQMIADHLRAAVHSRSSAIVSRTVFAHTGWRQVGGRYAYLTASGALGALGLDDSVTVDLGPLDGYALPDPADPTAVRQAILVSLALLEVAPDELSVPLLGAVFRAPLPLQPDCAVWIWGRSGTYKTAFTALAQQHWGATMDAQALPGNWTSTGNALEAQAFTLDSALFVVDDYSPDATAADAQRRAQVADRLIRGMANRSGRARLRPDGTERPPRPPRAQLLTSAEDMPPGIESLRARALISEVSPGDIRLAALTTAQAAAAAGTLALANAAYIRQLAARYDADHRLPDLLRARRDVLRDKARVDGHPRAALNVASLALGWAEQLDCAAELGAVTPAERKELAARTWTALLAVGADQERYRLDADPVGVYLRSLQALIASGGACVAGPKGGPPLLSPERWGWDHEAETGMYRSRGELVGWTDGADLFLEPDAALAAARRFAERAGQRLEKSKRAIHKEMNDRGLLAGHAAGKLTVAKALGGKADRHVVHLSITTFDQVGEQ